MNDEKHKCEGNCLEYEGEHVGDIRLVEVSGQWLISPVEFWYCQNAIDSDIQNGFTVIIL